MKGQQVLLILLYCFFFIQCEPTHKEFKKHGKATKGKIGFKQEVEKSNDYVLLVYFFTQDTLISHNPKQNNFWKNDSMPLEEKIEKWNEMKKKMGNVFSAEIIVDFNTFSRYKEGDVVEIIYLPKNPHRAILKESLN